MGERKSDVNWKKKEDAGGVVTSALECPEGGCDLHRWAAHTHTQGHTRAKEQVCAQFPWPTCSWSIASCHPKRIKSFESLLPSATPAVCLLGISGPESTAALSPFLLGHTDHTGASLLVTSQLKFSWWASFKKRLKKPAWTRSEVSHLISLWTSRHVRFDNGLERNICWCRLCWCCHLERIDWRNSAIYEVLKLWVWVWISSLWWIKCHP